MVSRTTEVVPGGVVPIDRVDPADRRALNRFVALERKLWGHEPMYWSELDADLVKRFRGQSAFNREMDHALWVIVDHSGNHVGRAVGYVNSRWQRQRDLAAGFIGNFCFAPASPPDRVAELFGAVEAWLAERGCTHVICGIDGTGALGMGVLTADHEASPMYPIRWHPPEYARLIESAGYQPIRRYWTYLVHFDDDRYQAAVRRALRETDYDVRSVDRRRWKDDVELIRHLFNETFVDEWEMNEYTREEFIEVWGTMRWLFDPRAFLIAEIDGEPAGFCLGLPDITPLVRSFHGRFGAIEVARMVRGIKKVGRHGVFVAGVRDRFRGRGIAQTLTSRILNHYEQLGMGSALLYWVDDENMASRGLCESLGAEGGIKLHCYQKTL